MGDSRNAHSIHFGIIDGSIMDAVAVVRDAVAATSVLKPGGEYRLSRSDQDGARLDVVASHRGLPRDALPAIEEDAVSFNQVSFPLYADLPDLRIVNPTLTLQTCRKGIALNVIFASDVLEWAGASWIVKTLDVLLPALGLDAAILCDKKDEGDVSRRADSGEPIRSIVLDRAIGRDPLPPPVLGMVRADRCDSRILREARARGVSVWMT